VPLDPGRPDTRLGGLTRADRIDEMGFLLPVRRDDARVFSARALADAFETYATNPLVKRYAERAAALGFPTLEGHLRGFVDLVFRQHDLWYVVDYKSNWLGPVPSDYEPDALGRAMLEHDYVLQYHLYLVALHRHLGQRLAGYDYDRHMGGAYTLFLRGMSPENPPGRGVLHDRPPRELVDCLSELLS
jgi:exodeoxyribonuclease V beta subunit